MTTTAVKSGFYQHYKGKYYQVLGVATHSESMESLVVYRALYGEYGLWVRPSAMFSEMVQLEDQVRPRFTYVGDIDPTLP